ncbi:MAG: YiiX/YebB-like N1pC/P60 family cysteine hydrolase [Desulfuromonadaceae bacterium]|nr:YiiX/YebB-like N1pC/P60 family cysteine hydrolase [Desulfuromonadaceae bacterium]MDD2848329.1 YiiX/YebB-like N1pC/P60 family cysteine hydrolase [Desulfuromonadaceae bacterium]MDD4129275.1 YiiX/YebB-like N1pC/P60 family cysteine hydrolase [Desulfuromonadaceae bacterium]
MKRTLLLITTLLTFALSLPVQAADSCRQHLIESHGTTREMVELSLKNEVAAFRTLAERALTLRAETIKVGMSIKKKMDNGKPLSGDDISMINIGINEHLSLREELLRVAESHECWLDGSEKELARQGISPESRLTGVMLSLSSAMLLYDNYLLAVSLFEGDSKLRRILNERDPGYAVTSAALARVTVNYNSISNRARVRKAIKFYEHESARFKTALALNPDNSYLSLLIAQSPSTTMVKNWSPFYVIGRKLGFLTGVTTDTLSGMERDGVSLFSMVFGNAVGLIETRKGKLYHNGEVLADVSGSLRAGDILLEKTPFRLTDKLIPGYWGHAAVWIGTEAELKELGIWDNPLVARYHDEIREGRLVVEALRSGVEMNTIQHFLNIDSIGILRRQDQSREARATTVIQALRQVGKPYDFNFDVESKERVYCSKLVYLSYSGIDWPTKRSLGRTTFTPDDVAVKAGRNGGLQLVKFYHDGRRVTDSPELRMAELMGTALAR